jgi:hypothetical protein
VTDIKNKQTKSQCFHESLRKHMSEATGPKRTEVDVIRTAIWFASIKQRLSASTAYEIERRLEPDGFGYSDNNDPYHKNKWSKYQTGQRTPSKDLITRVDSQLPGTQCLIDHVLWKCLKIDFKNSLIAGSWFKELSPNIQQIIFEDNSSNIVGNASRIKFSEVQLKMLERRAGIESLACLIILFHESYSAGSHERALEIGISIYKVLLILSNTLPFKHFTIELFYIFNVRVFSKINANGLGFRFDEFNFVDAVELLNTLLLILEDNGQSTNSVHTMIHLIDGKYGFDIMSALNAPIGPMCHKFEINQKIIQRYDTQEKLRVWGKDNLYSPNREKFPHLYSIDVEI